MRRLSDTHNRRQIGLGLAALGLLGATAFGSQLSGNKLPTGDAIPSAPGFKRLPAQQGVTGAALLTLGLDPPSTSDRPPNDVPFLQPVALGHALFRSTEPGLQLAVFSDYFCPVCPKVAPLLSRSRRSLSVTWHDWPLLGARSLFAARISIAASAFADPGLVHQSIMAQRPRPSHAGAWHVADDLGIDPTLVINGLDNPDADARLRTTHLLAHQLGLVGVPAFVIGSYVLSGLPPLRLLRQIVDAESAANAERVLD